MNKVILRASKAIRQEFTHPLMEKRGGKRAVLAVITDKRFVRSRSTRTWGARRSSGQGQHRVICGGRKAAQFVARTKRNLAAEFTLQGCAVVCRNPAISKQLQEMFLKGEVDCVDVIFTRFINTLTQKVEVRRLLPIGNQTLLNEGMANKDSEPEEAGLRNICLNRREQVLGILPHF